MPAETDRQAMLKVIRAWSDQPECDKLGSHEEEELADRITAEAAPAIEEQARKQERERLLSPFVRDAVTRMLSSDEQDWKEHQAELTEDVGEMLAGLSSLLFLLDGTDSIFEEADSA